MRAIRNQLCVAIAVLAHVATWQASGQEWPQRPIRIIVAFGAGGGADIIGRTIGQAMQDALGQPVVIENRPGAGGTIGNEPVARAEKDGYTLGIMTAGQIIAATTKKTLRYAALADFAPVSLVATASLLIVARPDFPPSNVTELVPRPTQARSYLQARDLAQLSTSRRSSSCRPRVSRWCTSRSALRLRRSQLCLADRSMCCSIR
jgi:tripartite-type tricarboxylate transporter receptor subunit TctC